jgi:uncharacterized protein (DUF58 family)
LNSDDVVSGGSPEHQALIESPAALAIAGFLAFSAALHLYLLTAALAILLGMIGVAKLWSLLSLRSLSGDRRLTYERVFPGDMVELVVRLQNRKLLPLPWVEISQPLPSGLLAKDNAPVSTMRGALLWYQAATFRPLLSCHRRGYLRLGPATITSGDPLGIYPNQRALRQPTNLLVYPRLYPLYDMQLAPNALFGEALSQHHLLYDPVNSAGSRDYVPGDPVRHIHWKATAKRQHHQVKVFEPTTNIDTLLLLAIDSFERRPEHDLELGISAASLSPLREGGVTAVATAIGALIPVFPFLVASGRSAIVLSFVISMLSHFIVGGARSVFTGRSIFRSGFDMFIVGLGVAVVGYLVGEWVAGLI